MATQVKIKRRTADATAPSGLTAGEMAINLVDKKLYVGGTAGTNTIFLDSTAVAVLGTANTFTALNSFSAGISASGATFSGSISGATATFSKDITVNSITVGVGGGGIDSNVAVGLDAFVLNTDGNRNVAVGQYALYANTEGSSNVGVGRGALASNTEGSYNVGVGRNALNANTTGSGNVGVGAYALGEENTSGSDNVGVGTYSLYSNTTGSNKTAIGFNAGRYRGTGSDDNTTGTGGIYIGYQARGSTLAQTNEIVIGVDALGLGSNTAVIGATLQSAATVYGVLNLPSGLSAAGATFSGDITVNSITVGRGGGNVANNIAFGLNTLLSNTIGQSNVAIGGQALPNNTEGTGNIAIGGSVLNNNTTGSYNIAIGAGSMYWSTESEDNVAIGANVMTTSLNYVPGSYNTGIGNYVLSSSGFTGESNVAIGYAAAKENTTSSYNVAIGFESLRNNSTGLYNTSVGSGALRHGNSINVTPGGSQMTALGFNAGRYRATGASSLTTGTGGIFIGYQARGSTNGQTNEIVIGVDALGLGSHTAVIGATLQSAATIYGLLNLPSGLSASGATFTGNISASNIVNSFNGATGAVTGASLGANTFTQLNTFSAGISASGATLSATKILSESVYAITSARTVTVNFQNGNIQTLTGLGSGATGSSAIGFTGASATGSSTVTMIITNGGLMTSNTTFWSTAVKWPGGFKTTLSTSGVDILTFTTIDAGTNIYGMLGGKAFS